MSHPDTVHLAGFDQALRWSNEPVEAASPDPGSLTISAGPTTDLFRDPGGPDVFVNAPMLLGAAPEGDLVLEAVLDAELSATYDAGALMVVAGEDRWAKFALELSPQLRPTIVSVVTNGWSDDANAIEIDEPVARLRLSRTGTAFACHVRHGDLWYLARYFRAPEGPCRVGFLAQSPTGEGLRASFTEISLERRTVHDVRDGS